jgi:hypothetical protein
MLKFSIISNRIHGVVVEEQIGKCGCCGSNPGDIDFKNLFILFYYLA